MTNGLGRGLGSLIPAKGSVPVRSVTPSAGNERDRILELPIADIGVNPYQPRKDFPAAALAELVESIKQYGIIQPLIVSKQDGKYVLVAGERRLRASKLAGLLKLPVIVRDATKQQQLEVALIENIQRENLSPIEMAVAYRRLMDEFGLTQEDVAKRVGKARPSVANTLRYLNLPEQIQTALGSGKITEGHAKYLAGLPDADKQVALFNQIIRDNLTIDRTNEAVKRIGGTKQARIKINYQDKDKEFRFRQYFGAKVAIKRKGKGGQVIIEFYSDEELNELVKKVIR